MLKRLANWLSLTPAERKVLLFLTATLIAGAAIRAYQEKFPPDRNFDYGSLDSSFAAFREHIAADTATISDVHQDRPLDINTASVAELLSLPGIGKTLAERIVERRDQEGRFRRIEDLMLVKGISKKKLEKLKPLITF